MRVFNIALRSNSIFHHAKVTVRNGNSDIHFMVIHSNLSFVLAPLPGNKKGRAIARPQKSTSSDCASTSVVTRKKKLHSSRLQITNGHFSRLAILFKIISQLLTFTERMHTCSLNSGDVNKRIQTAVFRLNETKAFCCVKPFNCAGAHMNPFHSNIDIRV